MNKLIIMVGLSGSGKSSIANMLSIEEDAVIVSSDLIRAEISTYEDQSRNDEVFRIFHKRIRQYLKDGKNVIADATNLTIKSRRAVINCANGINCKITAYVVGKRFDDCIVDNTKREHSVPSEVIHNQIRKFQVPFWGEGFDYIKIDTLNYNHFPINDYIEPMLSFDQKTKWHSHTLDIHSLLVRDAFINKYGTLSLGALYHDIGKPLVQTFDDNGEAHYYQHENVGAYILMTVFETATLYDIFLVNYHMMPFNWNSEKTHDKYRKLFGDEMYDMLIYFNQCDRDGE